MTTQAIPGSGVVKLPPLFSDPTERDRHAKMREDLKAIEKPFAAVLGLVADGAKVTRAAWQNEHTFIRLDPQPALEERNEDGGTLSTHIVRQPRTIQFVRSQVEDFGKVQLTTIFPYTATSEDLLATDWIPVDELVRVLTAYDKEVAGARQGKYSGRNLADVLREESTKRVAKTAAAMGCDEEELFRRLDAGDFDGTSLEVDLRHARIAMREPTPCIIDQSS